MENNFKIKINDLINDFQKWNNLYPNELWVGYQEKYDLEDYLNNGPISMAGGPIYLDEKSTLIFCGLKVRLTDKNSYLKLEYNPHY